MLVLLPLNSTLNMSAMVIVIHSPRTQPAPNILLTRKALPIYLPCENGINLATALSRRTPDTDSTSYLDFIGAGAASSSTNEGLQR